MWGGGVSCRDPRCPAGDWANALACYELLLQEKPMDADVNAKLLVRPASGGGDPTETTGAACVPRNLGDRQIRQLFVFFYVPRSCRRHSPPCYWSKSSILAAGSVPEAHRSTSLPEPPHPRCLPPHRRVASPLRTPGDPMAPVAQECQRNLGQFSIMLRHVEGVLAGPAPDGQWVLWLEIYSQNQT